MMPLPATIIRVTPESIIIPVTLEAFVPPPCIPFALSIAQPIVPLLLPMPDDGIRAIPMIVAIIPLRLGLRPAGETGKGYESQSQSNSGQKL